MRLYWAIEYETVPKFIIPLGLKRQVAIRGMYPLVACFIVAIVCENIRIDKLPLIDEYKSYCSPVYRRPSSEFPIKKAIVLFRHGNRAPLNITQVKWYSQNCKSCFGENCKDVKCRDGMLLTSGYVQGEELGRFIKKNYGGLVDKVKAHSSGVDRTNTMLSAVLSGMGKPAVKYTVDVSLASDNTCVKMLADWEVGKHANLDYSALDAYLTSMCNAVPLNCAVHNCASEQVQNTISTELRNYELLTDSIKNDLAATATLFKDLAKIFHNTLGSDNSMLLLSAHDSTLSRALNGLNTDMQAIPPLGSALIIEVLADKSNKEYVRVIFEGKLLKFGLNKESQMPLSSFDAYLKWFVSNTPKITETCQAYGSSKISSSSANQQIANYFDAAFRVLWDKEAQVVTDGLKGPDRGNRSAKSSSWVLDIGKSLLLSSGWLSSGRSGLTDEGSNKSDTSGKTNSKDYAGAKKTKRKKTHTGGENNSDIAEDEASDSNYKKKNMKNENVSRADTNIHQISKKRVNKNKSDQNKDKSNRAAQKNNLSREKEEASNDGQKSNIDSQSKSKSQGNSKSATNKDRKKYDKDEDTDSESLHSVSRDSSENSSIAVKSIRNRHHKKSSLRPRREGNAGCCLPCSKPATGPCNDPCKQSTCVNEVSTCQIANTCVKPTNLQDDCCEEKSPCEKNPAPCQDLGNSSDCNCDSKKPQTDSTDDCTGPQSSGFKNAKVTTFVAYETTPCVQPLTCSVQPQVIRPVVPLSNITPMPRVMPPRSCGNSNL